MEASTPVMRSARQEAILRAAERLFADHGFHAVTLRQIAEAAQVPLALVGYYFGRKNELFHAIFDLRRPWYRERAAALDDARDRAREPHGLRRIVETLVLPMLQLRQQAATAAYARLLARELLLGSDHPDHPFREHLEPLAVRFMEALRAAAPQAHPAALAWACQFSFGAIGMHVRDARIERMSQGRARAHDPGAAPRLVAYILGGLQAALHDTAHAPEAVPIDV